MFKADSELQGSKLTLQFKGTVDESFKIELPDPKKVKEVHVHCKGVVRINSAGLKAWIKFFQALKAQKTSFTFHECSTAVVEQANLLPNFMVGGTVESLMVPFCCGGCGSDLAGFFRVEPLRRANFEVPSLDCPNCGASAEFDDFVDHYFGFLKKA
jgi:hypothetical protein